MIFLAAKLVDILEKRADELAKRWVRLVIEHEMTPGYAVTDEVELCNRARNVYASLGKYLDHSFSVTDARTKYYDLGKRRYREGFGVVELMVALSLEKIVLWEAVQEEGLTTSFDLQGALELLAEVSRFFDKALIWSIMGYEDEKTAGTRTGGERRPTGRWFAVKPSKD